MTEYTKEDLAAAQKELARLERLQQEYEGFNVNKYCSQINRLRRKIEEIKTQVQHEEEEEYPQ